MYDTAITDANNAPLGIARIARSGNNVPSGMSGTLLLITFETDVFKLQILYGAGGNVYFRRHGSFWEDWYKLTVTS